MPHKDPNNYSFFDWLLVSAVALWASLSAYIMRQPPPQTLKTKIYFLLQDFIISGGVTYLVFMACLSYGIEQGIAAFFSGVAGHKATRFMYLIEIYVRKKLGILDTKNVKDK